MMALMAAASLQCISVGNSQWLVRDTQEECLSSLHFRYLLTVSVPFFTFFVFTYALGTAIIVRKPNWPIGWEVRKYLSKGYRKEEWELAIGVRWLFVSTLAVFFPKLDRLSQAVLLAGLVGASIKQETIVLPYNEMWVNVLSLALQGLEYCVLMVTLCTSGEVLTGIVCFALLIVGVLVALLVFRGRRSSDVYPMPSLDGTMNAALQRDSSISGMMREELDIFTPPPSVMLN